jgi:hypothetical protein
LQIAKDIAKEFIKEGCRYLKISTPPLMFMPFPPILVDTVAPAFLLKDHSGIVINNYFLEYCIKKKSFTPLRIYLYCLVRQIYTHQNKLQNEKTEIDACAYAMALSMVKGLRFDLSLFNNGINTEELRSRMLEILHQEFHLICELRTDLDTKDERLRLSLTPEFEEYYSNTIKQASIATIYLADTNKGTQDTPFEDINEACKYIKKIEVEAYDNDGYLNTTIAKMDYFYDRKYQLFRIPFAHPYVTLLENRLPHNAFIVNQLESHRFSLKPNLYRRKFLYRGQSKYYDRCVPTLFRDEKQNYFLKELIWGDEMTYLISSHPLVKLLGDGVSLLHDKFIFEMNYSGLAQHYGTKTGLLDLTSNLGAAKFFAVTNYNSTTNEYEPFLSNDEIGVLYYYEIKMPHAFHPNEEKGYHLSTIGKQVFMRSGAQHGFLLEMSKDSNFNDFAEVHKVFFKHVPAISQEIFDKQNQGKELFPVDILEKAWRAKMNNIATKKKVSLQAVLNNQKRNQNETIMSLIRKLYNEGIIVDNYIPQFTSAQLKEYYDDIKNGWWEEFCKDIYFYGTDGALYKEELLNLPNRSEYKWAFKDVRKGE